MKSLKKLTLVTRTQMSNHDRAGDETRKRSLYWSGLSDRKQTSRAVESRPQCQSAGGAAVRLLCITASAGAARDMAGGGGGCSACPRLIARWRGRDHGAGATLRVDISAR